MSAAALRAAAERHRDAPAWLWAFLRGVLDDDEQLRELAADSASHPTGFVKIVVLPRASPRLRLHVWHPSRRASLAGDKVHEHRWAFASWIITGQLRETTYSIESSGRSFDVYRYAGESKVPRVKLGTCMLAPGITEDRMCGDIYTRERHELHVAEPVGEGLVVSLVLQGPAAEWTPIYRPAGSRDLGENKPVTPRELCVLLTDVINILEPVA
ncbi:MAG: hypothetical protein L0K86_07375 [Actinomycetia bacterium]|nr:hypothetical protein [Actinomycetes bacterium]